MFDALEELAHESCHHDHECGAPEDVCDDRCSIASAVIAAEGQE
jgi:hypothetical protein